MATKDVKKEVENKDDTGPKVADWRFGPAQIWYDMLEVPETGDDFDYGFKVSCTRASFYSHVLVYRSFGLQKTLF